jgi:hypothetical protein
MTRIRITPEVQSAAIDAGLRFDGSGAGLPAALIASGVSILVDKDVVRTIRLQHYDAARKLLLIEVQRNRKASTGFAVAGLHAGRAFVAHVLPAAQVGLALNGVLPPEVVEAQDEGKPIYRQGNWFFYPDSRLPKAQMFHFHPLDDDHVAERVAVPKFVCSHLFVLGMVTHPEHRTLYFEKWHRAVRIGRIN